MTPDSTAYRLVTTTVFGAGARRLRGSHTLGGTGRGSNTGTRTEPHPVLGELLVHPFQRVGSG